MAFTVEGDRDNIGTTKAKRDKYWSELGIEEKLERMRDMVKLREKMILSLLEQVRQLKRVFIQHSHRTDGAAVLSVDHSAFSDDTDQIKRVKQDPDKVFF